MGEITEGMLGQEEDAEMSGLDPQDGTNDYMDPAPTPLGYNKPNDDYLDLNRSVHWPSDKMVDADWREDSTPREHMRSEGEASMAERLDVLDMVLRCPTCRQQIASPVKSLQFMPDKHELGMVLDTSLLAKHVQKHVDEVKRVQAEFGFGG